MFLANQHNNGLYITEMPLNIFLYSEYLLQEDRLRHSIKTKSWKTVAQEGYVERTNSSAFFYARKGFSPKKVNNLKALVQKEGRKREREYKKRELLRGEVEKVKER